MYKRALLLPLLATSVYGQESTSGAAVASSSAAGGAASSASGAGAVGGGTGTAGGAAGAGASIQTAPLQPSAASAATPAMGTATRTDEASAATVTNEEQECAIYYYAPVASLIPEFPTIWTIATIPDSDTVAQGYFDNINSSIPNISPKGTPMGDFSTFTPTYDRQDPDCWWTFNRCTTPKIDGLEVDISTCQEPNTWGYTLDDGPNCSHNAFYDFLNEHNQKASLFYIGSNVLDWPLEAQRGLADGHEICAHTWSHRYMTALTNEQAFAELYYSKKAIHDVLGITVNCWRPPFGDVDDRIRFIANQLGMKTVIWDHDTFDYQYATIGLQQVRTNYEYLLNNQSEGLFQDHGTVVLSHELNNNTIVMAQDYLPRIQQAFDHVVPVGVCNNITTPYEEKDYVYPDFDAYVAGTTTASNLPSVTMNTESMSVPVATSSGKPVSIGDDDDNNSKKDNDSSALATISISSITSFAGIGLVSLALIYYI